MENIGNPVIIYIKNSPAQKKANKKYYDMNKDIINEQKRIKYNENKQNKEFKDKINNQAKINYQKRKNLKK
jgi:hypothetical protein